MTTQTINFAEYLEGPKFCQKINVIDGATHVTLDTGGNGFTVDVPEGAETFLIDHVCGCIDFYTADGVYVTPTTA